MDVDKAYRFPHLWLRMSHSYIWWIAILSECGPVRGLPRPRPTVGVEKGLSEALVFLPLQSAKTRLVENAENKQAQRFVKA